MEKRANVEAVCLSYNFSKNMHTKRISLETKTKIISLSGKIFWYWKSFYNFYAPILEISSRKLENKMPRGFYNKYEATEKILEELEANGNIDSIKIIVSEFYNLSTPFDKNDNPKYQEAKIELLEFKKNVGKDVLEEKNKKDDFKKQIEKRRVKNELEKMKSKKIQEIKKKFFELAYSTDRQVAGFYLEKALYQILELEKIDHHKPYKTDTEQIDGYFNFDKWDYLVEIKWTIEKVKQKDVSIFDGKIKRKAQSTRGVILSISGFDDSAVIFASGDSPKIIFLDMQDFINVLDERLEIKDILKTKIDKLVRYGKVY